MSSSLTKDMSVDPRFMGIEVLLSPFASLCSSPRLIMYGGNLPQVVVINGCDLPKLFTGYEFAVGEYEWDDRGRERPDAVVSAVIPKHTCCENNDALIIYTTADESKQIGFYNIKEVTNNRKFGYKNHLVNYPYPEVNDFIEGGVKLTTSSAHDGNSYMLGTNANVLFLDMPEVSEDAFVISKSLNDRLSHLAVNNMIIKLSYDDIILNLFGDDDNYKIMLDVGEKAPDGGIILGVRKTKEVGQVLADIKNNSLRTPQWLHDDLFKIPPGAEIIDIDVYLGNDKGKLKEKEYTQLVKYNNEQYHYFQSIVDTCDDLISQGYTPDVEMFNLLAKAMARIQERRDYRLKLVDHKIPIEIMIDITYAWTRHTGNGYKLTGRDGAKGVVSVVWEDEHMPVDEYGIRADLIIAPESPPARLNTGQWVAQFINRSAEIIRLRLMNNQLGDNLTAYDYIMDFVNDIRPSYAELLKNECKTKQKKEQFITAFKQDGLYICIPPYLNVQFKDIVLHIEKKFNITETPITYSFYSHNKLKQVTTKDTCCIGSKYIYLLNKIPSDGISATAFGYVSQFNTPVKSKSKNTKYQSVELKQTPIRLGEDESSILTMCCGSATTFRLSSLYANSPKGTMLLEKELLTVEHPSALPKVNITNDELAKCNINIQLASHMLGICGVQYKNIKQ